MAEYQTQSLDRLNLSWPQSVNYHADLEEFYASSPSRYREAKYPDVSSQEPHAKTTYNGVLRKLLKNGQPLLGDEIRILDLEKGTHEMPLAGSLRKVRLSDHPVYEPLSYTWEDWDAIQTSANSTENNVDSLYLMDSDCSLELTSNCAKALRSVRRTDKDRTIWVDSICVNQDDTEERSRQVDLMKNIYANAFTVLVYLGRESMEEDGSSTMAMSLLRQPDRLQDFAYLDERERTSLKRLFGRRYFRRMWIVQEVALAQTIEFHCGSDIAYVSEFAGNPLEAILGSRVTPPWLRHSRQATRGPSSGHETSQAQQILNLIFDTALCDCKDDRDRIFAIFSLVNSSDTERLRTDYNLSTAEVFTGIAAYLAKNGFLWVVLMLAPHLNLNYNKILPSWTPDWSNVREFTIQPEPHLFRRMASNSHDSKLDTGFEVSKSGVITIRGLLLGSVTNPGYSPVPIMRRFGHMHGIGNMYGKGHLDAELLNDKRDPGRSARAHEHRSLWTLSRRGHMKDKSLGSWKWHFEFATRSKQPIYGNHVALMLLDYSTVLILRLDEFRDSYTLVESGMPIVWTSCPEYWKVGPDHRRPNPLASLRNTPDLKMTHWDTIRSSRELFPRLSKLPEMWGYNPLTSTMTLTNKAISSIRLADMSELSLMERWRKHARTCVQVLRDKYRLGRLIDKVDSLYPQDYVQIEEAAALEEKEDEFPRRPLDRFLGLFIRDPFKAEPMVWPDVQLHGDQALDEIAMLQQLMQWALVFNSLVLRMGSLLSQRWLQLPQDQSLNSDAWSVSGFQISTTSDASDGLNRTSMLLRKILRQLSDEPSPEFEHIQGPRSRDECYWDWRRFDSVLEQRFSGLSQIRPEVEKIKADLGDLEPDSTVLAHQVLAAHGFDTSKKEFTQIRIR